jgi:hypothetical protein
VALCIALIAARLINPCSMLATSRLLDDETATCSLGQVLGLAAVDEQELYEALDWLIGQQERIEAVLARRHLKNGMLVLYGVSSTYFEGRTCALARFGYNRGGKKGKLQIVFGLLCTAEGCPVAVEVFEGNVGEPSGPARYYVHWTDEAAISAHVWAADRLKAFLTSRQATALLASGATSAPGEPTISIRQHHCRETNLPNLRSWRYGPRHRHALFPARRQVCPKDAPGRPPFRPDAARLTRR